MKVFNRFCRSFSAPLGTGVETYKSFSFRRLSIVSVSWQFNYSYSVLNRAMTLRQFIAPDGVVKKIDAASNILKEEKEDA